MIKTFLDGMKVAFSFFMSITFAPNANNGKYLSEVAVVKATSYEQASKLAKENGYKILSETSLYGDETDATQSYLVGKTTNDEDEALTDIRVMNMKGGFSSEAYEQMLESNKDNTTKVVSSLKSAINEYKENYNRDKDLSYTTGATYAYKLLSYIYDDDILVNDEPITIADLFLSNNLSDETLTTLFLQGNSEIVSYIEQALAHACGASTDALKVANIIDVSEDELDDYNNGYDEIASSLASSLSSFTEPMRFYTNSGYNYPDAESYNIDEMKDYIKGLNEQDATTWVNGCILYKLLAGFDYLGTSFADFILNLDVDADDFDYNVFYPILDNMSEGQRAAVAYSGLDIPFLCEFYSYEKITTSAGINYKMYDGLVAQLNDQITVNEKVSIFDGVDRRLFTADGIALTSEALRQNNAKNDYDWYLDLDAKQKEMTELFYKIGIYAGIAAVSAVGLAGSAIGATYLVALYSWGDLSMFIGGLYWQVLDFWASEFVEYGILGKRFIQMGKTWFTVSQAKFFINCCYAAYHVFQVLMTVAAVAFAVCLIAFVIYEIYSSDKSKITYDDIPEIMVSEQEVDGNAIYSAYYNVKDIYGNLTDLTDAETNNHSQWVALYQSKDKNVGSPILASSVVVDDETGEDDVLSIRKFGETSAYQLNTYSKDRDKYVHYQTKKLATAGSIFSNVSSWLLLLAGLLLGGLVGSSLTYYLGKKKKKELATN